MYEMSKLILWQKNLEKYIVLTYLLTDNISEIKMFFATIFSSTKLKRNGSLFSFGACTIKMLTVFILHIVIIYQI